MRNVKEFVSAIAGVLSLLLVASSVSAQEPVVVRVTPANLSLAVGNTSDIAVEIVDVEGLYGFDIQLSFDPTVLEVVDADPDRPGTQVSLGRMLEPGMSVRDGADNAAGTIHYAMTQLNPSEAKSGTGNLIVIKLRGKAAGDSDLTITSVDLARRDASAIEASPQPGAVTVTAGASTQPTNTPIPTQAPPTAAPTGLPAAQAAAPQATATALPSATPADVAPTATTPALATTDTPTTAAETALADPTATVAATDPAATAPAEADAVAPVEDVNPQETKAAAPAQPDETVEVTPEPTDTPQAVSAVAAESGSAAQPASSSPETGQVQDDNTEDTLLTVGIGALLAAAAVAVILLILLARRRATS